MIDKWDTQSKSKKKGYLKIHVAVNTKTKEILAFLEVTDEKVHDGKKMKALVERVMKRNNNNYKIKTAVLADGGHMIVIRISNI